MSESENIDLPNTLYVTKDAFDQFQTEQANEENEFITLSDIVDPPQETLDLNSCLDEIQDDTCIVSESESELQHNQNIMLKSTVETSEGPISSLNIPLTGSKEKRLATGSSIKIQTSQTVPDILETIPQLTHKKRGRKRKNMIASVDVKEQVEPSAHVTTIDQCVMLEKGNVDPNCGIVSDKNVFNTFNKSATSGSDISTRQTLKRKRKLQNDAQIKLQQQVIETIGSGKPRKRGRPKKLNTSIIHQDPSNSLHGEYTPLGNLPNQGNSSLNHAEKNSQGDNSSITAKTSSNQHQHSVTSVLNTEQHLDKKTPCKPRKPKKSKINNKGKSEDKKVNDTLLVAISKQNSTVSSSKPEIVESKNKVEGKKYDDIELELLRMLSSPTKELEVQSNKEETGNKQMVKKKRGRKPKNMAVESEKCSDKPHNKKATQTVVHKEVCDEADDICLSSLKMQLRPEDDHREENILIVNETVNTVDSVQKTSDNFNEVLTKRNSKKSIMSDFEYNVDTVVSDSVHENDVDVNESEIESPSKRPVRKKAKKVLHYDEGSDEDPFANVELSDDDGDLSGRRGGRYYSDDEYIPGKRKKGKPCSESSMSESEELESNDGTVAKKLGKKKGRKSVELFRKKQSKKNNQSQSSISDVTSTAADTTTQIDDDLEHSHQSPDNTLNENQKQSEVWGVSHEFESFIAQKIQGTNLKIKKLTGTNPNESAITPLEIPVLDPNEPKKTVEVSSQTIKALTKTVEVQTTSPHESIMKYKVPLSAEQAEKACEFLKSIVKNTSELGQLMIQKSEDFIQKKINTKNLTDTNKIDYCVQKSFLLFKLAKHNLIQMEEDLANEYEQFLTSYNMLQYRETPKCITASSRQTDSDSDCEIVEETIPDQEKDKGKSKFNLKTVFLNKELSIKIAKKSTEEPQRKKEKVNISDGRHTVWINDSIKVKRVKPTQSFLAQDSRNKKPPDSYITNEMVKNFFDNHYKQQQVLLTCAPFVSPEWLNVNQMGICNYFIAQSNGLSSHSRKLLTQQMGTEQNTDRKNIDVKENHMVQPTSLLALCTKVLHKYMYETKANHIKSLFAENNYCLPLYQEHQPNTLFRLSLNVISKKMVNEKLQIFNNEMLKDERKSPKVTSLKKLCLKCFNNLINMQITSPLQYDAIHDNSKTLSKENMNGSEIIIVKEIKKTIKSLFSFCVEVIQMGYLSQQESDNFDIDVNCLSTFKRLKTLKSIALENVQRLLCNDFLDDRENSRNERHKILEGKQFPQNDTKNEGCIEKGNQLLALTIKSVNTVSDDIFAKLPDIIDEEPSYSDDDDSNSNYDEYERDYADSTPYDNFVEDSNWVSRVQLQELKSCFMPVVDNSETTISKEHNQECILASIKIEPLEETPENIDSSIVKTETTENDEIVFNPLATKLENPDNNEVENVIPEQSSYDVDTFEEFARTSKMLHIAAGCDLASDEIFSQSALRVRKQHEPDIDDEFDTSMSLLIPQQSAELLKDRLMKSSSDDESNSQKTVTKKKRKVRPKTSRLKNKDITTIRNKNMSEDEVSLLTRKMQEKIRQEEKSCNSSDSEFESSLAKLKQSKFKKETRDKAKLKPNKVENNEIQCNDVDSTENLNDKTIISHENKKELSQPLKMSLRKIIKRNNLIDSNNTIEQHNSFVILPGTPVELLECEPSLPMMHDMENIQKENDGPDLQQQLSCIDRYGWKCYPVNNNDTKLYEHTYILLEKLPESFVETYFRYQDIAPKNQDDADIDRLTNLQSLHRCFSKDIKMRKQSKTLANGQLTLKDTGSVQSSSINNDFCNELTPSEDEGPNIDDEISSAFPQNTSENVMAKNSLINEMYSDSEKLANPGEDMCENKSIKKEKDEINCKKYRPGPKSKKGVKENESTFLTADKMMNKELALLHAPVTLDSPDAQVKDAIKKHAKNLNKTSSRHRAHLERGQQQVESSSEEEKQWVTTKEKLLKRMGKKQENSSVDDAKRAKIVNEFIEKRGDAHDKRPITRVRKRRSRKKFLERKKQMSVLKRELFGETDTSYAGRKHSQTFGKGRRNIRKVIDKKSLARSTVVANMEEFERKRRLNIQQTRLREQLGCEEGVNVLVINDEVCLEYDFDEMRPVVTIHPFFTKVMKAHQYEGVKFMWDACFESLAMVAAGHAGGGCILAHCMGLGKTLQVLALLHTVLTHPGVGMKRVLVCCPLSTVLNWVDEINKWIGPVTNQIKVFELSKLKKTYERAYQLEDWYKDGGIFIIGYELFRSLTTLDPTLDEIKPKIVDKIRHALLNPGPDIVICDEGHLLKNDASVLAVAMSRVATKRRIVLTGTPMQNNLREYYCMVNFVKPSLLGTYAEYSNRFENPIMNGQHRDSQEEDIKLMKARTHILHKVLESCLQRQEASVLYPYLPKKHEYAVFIPPTQCQWDLYKHYMLTYALEQQQQNKQQKQNILKDFHVLQKIWTHPLVLHNFLMKARDERNKIKEEKLEDDLAQEDLAASEDVKPNQTEVWWLQYLAGGDMLESLESSNKFVVVFQLLAEFITLGDKVLIFSTSLYTMDALEYFLKRIKKWSLGQEYFRLDGSVPAEVRQKWCREFNAPNNVITKLFLISTRAGCLGLNMTAANRVIILDTSWNPAHDIQSIFRVYRFGQKKDCYIYRLVAMGTMEQKIYERSVTKQAVSCRVVDEQQIDRHYNMAELTELYRFDEEGATVEAGLAAGVSDVALLRVAARARLHAVREHDSLLRGSREQHLPEHERNAAWMQFQQEHANNELQDRLMEASQGIQRILEANYVKPDGSIPVKAEIKEETQPTIPLLEPKKEKSKKKAAKNSNPPLEEYNEQKYTQLESEKEEAKVKKIMQLLIKHNFHASHRAHEVTKLVTNVRSIVGAGGAGLEACDELTRSIASVMLQEEEDSGLSSPLEPHPLTDIMAGDVITNESRSEVNIHIKPDIPDETPEEITDRITYQNTPLDDPSKDLLNVPLMERSKRLRERPRKYFQEEIFEPTMKKTRGRRQKHIIDTEHRSVDNENNMSLRLRINQGTSSSMSRRSKRLMGSPRSSNASDIDSSVVDNYSSKEQSPDIEDAPLLSLANKQRRNKLNVQKSPGSDVAVVDVEDPTRNVCESIVSDTRDETIAPEIKKPRRAIAVKSTAKLSRPEENWNGKRKRKAALVAERHLEKFNNEDIVTLDDDDDDWVDDREENLECSTSTMTTQTQVSNTQNNDKNKRKRRKETIASSSQASGSNKKQGDSSILLSDDEESSKTNMEPEETVPLHPSMLTNPNFIKIVSYAYQSNQMLDEDAALLAARYSTQKALKEYETTGKFITSGPLYDIAVKVLTIDVLKKLYNNKVSKKKNQPPTAVNSVDLTSITPVPLTGVNSIDLTSITPVTPVEGTSQDVTYVGQQNSPQTSQPNVVPIGMFRGSAIDQKPHEVIEECILPDDDDCILGTTNDTLPRTQNLHTKTNSPQFTITCVTSGREKGKKQQPALTVETIVPEIETPVKVSSLQSLRNSVPRVDPCVTITERPKFIVRPNTPTYRLSTSNLQVESNTSELKQSKTSGPETQPCLTLTISQGKLVQQTQAVRDLNTRNVTPTWKESKSNIVKSSSNDTICLDSDEEEASTTSKAPKISRVLTLQGSTKATHTSAPIPIAVTTTVPTISGLNNAPVLNDLRSQAPSKTSIDKIKANQQNKNQQKGFYFFPDNLKQQDVTTSQTSKGASAPHPKLPKPLPKPSDNVQMNIKTVVRPEDVLNKVRTENQIKKICKSGDIVRITKEGNLAILSRVEKLPENLKAQLSNVFANSSKDTSSSQSVAGKHKTPSTPIRATSPGNDTLSIFKDVIHIQADEYVEPTNKTQPEKANNSFNHKEQSKSKEAGGKIILKYPSSAPGTISQATLLKKPISDPVIQYKNKESLKIKKKEVTSKNYPPTQADNIKHLTNFKANNKTVSVVHKSTDMSSVKGSVIVGSSKDIIIRTKPVGSTLTKVSTSGTNNNMSTLPVQREKALQGSDSKKRTSTWPDPNSSKKIKGGYLRPTQTLEDFDIDDIDDIIELE